MGKKFKKKEDKPKKNSFSGFLKKRAPIYLGLTGLFVLFIVPQLTGNSLEDLFPEDLTDKEKQVLDIVMSYDGPNEKGLTVLEAIDAKIKEEYEDKKIYDDKASKVLIDIATADERNYNVTFTLKADKKEMQYMWGVDIISNEIKSWNAGAKSIIDLVKFYD